MNGVMCDSYAVVLVTAGWKVSGSGDELAVLVVGIGVVLDEVLVVAGGRSAVQSTTKAARSSVPNFPKAGSGGTLGLACMQGSRRTDVLAQRSSGLTSWSRFPIW